MIQKQPIISKISLLLFLQVKHITNKPDVVKKQITAEMKDILIRPDDVLEKNEETIKENKAHELTKFTVKY